MNITPKQVLTLAAKYIGYKEKASSKDLYSFEGNAGSGNYTMFQAELDKAGFWNNAKQGFEWCTSFVAWCFWRIAGSEAKDILCLTGDYGAGCTAWARYYAGQGRLYSKPKVGDQYFQRGSDGLPCHTGIVESVSGSTFTTIEGNAGNMVKRVTRNVSGAYGFGRPKYSEITEDAEMTQAEFNKMFDAHLAELKTNSAGSWSEAARNWATETGVCAGDGKGNYSWPAYVTREQMVQFLYNFNEKIIKELPTATNVDTNAIAEAVLTAVKNAVAEI